MKIGAEDWLSIALWFLLPYVASAAIAFWPLWVAVPTVVICAFLWLAVSNRLARQ